MTDTAPLSSDAIATMTGWEQLQAMLDKRLPAPPMAGVLNFRLVAIDEGRAVFEGTPEARFFNPMGTVHGGWALTLIDSACGCAGHTLLPAGATYGSLETKVNFTRAIGIETGTVRCEGRVLHPGRRVMTASAEIRDAKHRLLAHGTSTLMVVS